MDAAKDWLEWDDIEWLVEPGAREYRRIKTAGRRHWAQSESAVV